MRICLVYDCLYPYTVGGAERWYRNLAERLGAAGHEVTYLTLAQWARDERPKLGGGVTVLAVGPRMALYTAGGRRRILPPLMFGLGVLAHLARHGRRYEVVHTCAFPYFSLLAAAATRRLYRYRLVVDWFEVWSRAYWLEYLGPLGGRIAKLVQHLCAHADQQAFCFSELHVRRLREEGMRGEVTVLRGLYAGESTDDPTETDPTAFIEDGSRAEAPVALFAGRLIAEKQAPLAAEAVALARERIPDLRGVFLGDGPERGALLATIARLGLGDSASAPGFVETQIVDREMRAALCLMLPSRREGYGLVVVEAAARGTPSVVVAGEDNAAVELIEEGVNGTVARTSDPRELADAIVRVYDAGPRLRASTASWFQRNARRLSLEDSVERVVERYSAGASAPVAERPIARA